MVRADAMAALAAAGRRIDLPPQLTPHSGTMVQRYFGLHTASVDDLDSLGDGDVPLPLQRSDGGAVGGNRRDERRQPKRVPRWMQPSQAPNPIR